MENGASQSTDAVAEQLNEVWQGYLCTPVTKAMLMLQAAFALTQDLIYKCFFVLQLTIEDEELTQKKTRKQPPWACAYVPDC